MLCVLCLYVGHVMSGCDQTLMYLLMNGDFLHTNYCMDMLEMCSNILIEIVIRAYGRMGTGRQNTQNYMLNKKGAPCKEDGIF
jgi:hypothetical protein